MTFSGSGWEGDWGWGGAEEGGGREEKDGDEGEGKGKDEDDGEEDEGEEEDGWGEGGQSIQGSSGVKTPCSRARETKAWYLASPWRASAGSGEEEAEGMV